MHFRNYGLRKTRLYKCLTIPLSEVPSRSNMVSGTKHCWNLNETTFTIFIDHCDGNWDGKPLLVICKILRLLVKTLNAGHKYCQLNRAKLKKPIQMQLSQKQKSFSQFVPAFLKARLNFKHFRKNDAPHSWCFSRITDSEKRC